MATQVAFSDLNSWLQSQPANTVDTPYELEITGLTEEDVGYSTLNNTLGYYLNFNRNKYVDLSETVLPNVTSLDSTFSSCKTLVKSPAIPNSVTSLSDTFYRCTSLLNAPVIPDSVTNLTTTFFECTSLVNAPVIPNGVTALWATFSGCTSLVNAPIIPDSVTSLNDTFSGCTSLVNPPVIPDGVTVFIGAFRGCTSLVNAPFIPDGVTDVQNTFYNCISLTYKPVIPSSVTSSYNCYTNVTTNNWKGTESQAESFLSTFFAQTVDSELQIYNNDRVTYEESIYNIDISTLSTYLAELDSNTVNTAYKIYIRGLTTSNCVYIHNDLDDNPAKFVDLSYTVLPGITSMDNFFCYQHDPSRGCLTLVKAPAIPNTVTLLSYTFAGCKNLQEAPDIPSSVVNMEAAFYGCSSITTPPVLESGVSYMAQAFGYCTSLTTAPTLPNGCENIQAAFIGTAINAVPTLPSSILHAGLAFANCKNITSTGQLNHLVNLRYAYSMFYNCSNLIAASELPTTQFLEDINSMFMRTKITELPSIPEGITNINQICNGCSGLATVKSLPSTITSGSNAFKDCTSLTKIDEFKIPLNTLKNNTNFRDMFTNCPNLKTIGYKQPESEWHAFRLKFGASSVEGKVFDKNGVGTAIASTSITKDTVNMPVLTDELWFPPNNMSDADIETLINKVISNRYTYWKKSVVDPTHKSFVLWADDENYVVTNVAGSSTSQEMFNIVHPVGEIYIQYPQQKDPEDLYNHNGVTSTWTLQTQYAGAFFRSSGGNASSFIEEGNTLTAQGQATAKNGLKLRSENGASSGTENITASGGVDHTHDMQHYHSRGTMNITGKFGASVPQNHANYCSGAFTSDSYTTKAKVAQISSSSATVYGYNFNASNSNTWTGLTSNSLNSSSVAKNNTDSASAYSHQHNIYLFGDTETRPANYTINIWKRTS